MIQTQICSKDPPSGSEKFSDPSSLDCLRSLGAEYPRLREIWFLNFLYVKTWPCTPCCWMTVATVAASHSFEVFEIRRSMGNPTQ